MTTSSRYLAGTEGRKVTGTRLALCCASALNSLFVASLYAGPRPPSTQKDGDSETVMSELAQVLGGSRGKGSCDIRGVILPACHLSACPETGLLERVWIMKRSRRRSFA